MRDDRISAMLAQRIAAGDFPSAVYIVAQRGEVVYADALGYAVTKPERHAATLETIYDLASLTKPFVTGLLCALRLQDREFGLDDKVADHLSEFGSPDKRTITLRQLLTHTSGLPAWLPLYLLAADKEAAVQVISGEPLESEPGTRVRYSDLGFIVLGRLLEKLGSKSLAELAESEIFQPLNLQRTFFSPEPGLAGAIAASEFGNAYERGMTELSPTQNHQWRENLIWGQVHDGNAYFLGGAAGHAGLFSNARETLILASQFLSVRTKLLQPETCRLFCTNMTIGLEEARSFAWQLAATPDSTAGPRMPVDAFGHLGFTGSSCWSDPGRARTFILLTNRTHTDSLPFVNINQTRRSFHTMAIEALDEREAKQPTHD
ncbi:MAG: hypothetical protein QOJ64_314 [Acidobacteriota bacterium]|jgi:CubicO group peptidase (beta-lactamase class C family)|nr:hypothetical protein [Acidobacteriota bacterium]